MHKEPHWVRAAYDVSGFLGCFAHEVNRFLPDRSEVRKIVMVAGQSHAFPERSIVCTAQSRFKIPRPDIHRLVLVDPGELIDPELIMKNPVRRQLLVEDDEATMTIERGTTFFPASLHELLPTMEPDSFNALLFFGIVDLDDQLEHGLGEKIERVLKPNGVFVGSGDFADGYIHLTASLALEQEVSLANHDAAGNPYSHRIGFVARKKPKSQRYEADAPSSRGANRESRR